MAENNTHTETPASLDGVVEKSWLDPDSKWAKFKKHPYVTISSAFVGAGLAVAAGAYFGVVGAANYIGTALAGAYANMARKVIISDYIGFKKGYYRSIVRGVRSLTKNTASFLYTDLPKLISEPVKLVYNKADELMKEIASIKFGKKLNAT